MPDAFDQQMLSSNAETAPESSSGNQASAQEFPWSINDPPVKSAKAATRHAPSRIHFLVAGFITCIIVAASFAFYYFPLRYLMNRSGYTRVSLGFYLQGFASMMGMTLIFSGLLVWFGQLMLS